MVWYGMCMVWYVYIHYHDRLLIPIENPYISPQHRQAAWEKDGERDCGPSVSWRWRRCGLGSRKGSYETSGQP